jgi:hypothetical protein
MNSANKKGKKNGQAQAKPERTNEYNANSAHWFCF